MMYCVDFVEGNCDNCGNCYQYDEDLEEELENKIKNAINTLKRRYS